MKGSTGAMQRESSRLFYWARRRPRLMRAEGVYMWDVTGKRYLDGTSGAMVCNIGHSNPAVLEAMRRQMEKSTFSFPLHFETEPAERLAERLAGLMPAGLERAYFVSGGSEAVESALKLARSYALAKGEAQRWKVISRYPAYHGCTLGALSVSGYTPMTSPYDPMMRAMPKIPAPRAYLDGLDARDPATGRHYADMLKERVVAEGPETVLAFIVEPVGGASTGALVPPEGYLQRIREICDFYGVLLIHDEVLSGGGRTGKFLAADNWGVVPDLVAIAKGLGSGYMPLGALIAHDHIVETVLNHGSYPHGFTYAGNPLSCAAGLAVIDEIERQRMLENSVAMGEILGPRLRALMHRYPLIGDVRGMGLLQAFELVADCESMAPLPKEMNACDHLVDTAHENGLIIYSRRSRGGQSGDHFLVAPPMIATEEHIDEIMEKLTKSLDLFMDRHGLN